MSLCVDLICFNKACHCYSWYRGNCYSNWDMKWVCTCVDKFPGARFYSIYADIPKPWSGSIIYYLYWHNITCYRSCIVAHGENQASSGTMLVYIAKTNVISFVIKFCGHFIFFMQILCNGPGTCIPICAIAFIFKVWYL